MIYTTVIKISVGQIIFKIINTIILTMLCISVLYPFMNLISISLSGFGPVTRNEITVFPKDLTWHSYVKVFESSSIMRAYFNTIVVTILTTFWGVMMTSFVAYPLSRPYFAARRFLTMCIAMTLWFSGGMIPTFMVVKSLHMYNSLTALIIPGLIQTYNVVIMLSFFRSLPQDLIDASKIDGCNEARTLFEVVYAISKPVLATVALWIAVGSWNDFVNPLLYLQDSSKYTLQIVLRDIIMNGSGFEYGIGGIDSSVQKDTEFMLVEESLRACTIVVSILPMLCVYPFLQKHFAKGVMIGSIKG